ncbi:MFS transporter [Microbacterium sp. GXF6406]
MTGGQAQDAAHKTSWLPMVSLFLAQVLMSFNVAALPISLGGIVEEFGVAPTVASSTIVVYGLAVAALVMTGAKLGQRIGWVLIFRVVIVLFAGSSLMMIFGPSIGWAIGGQAVAGAAAAIIVPSLVALIAENYRGAQQGTAIGTLGSARAFSGVSAFLIGGTLGTLVGWRPVFMIVLGIAVIVFALSFTLRGDRGGFLDPDRPCRGAPDRCGDRAADAGIQQPQWLGRAVGDRSRALQRVRPVARAAVHRRRHHAGAGVLPLDATPDGARRGAADRPEHPRLVA